MDDFTGAFSEFCAKLGYNIDGDILPDDKMHRVKVNAERTASASYQLKIDGDFAVGWFRSFKEGVTHKFHTSSGVKMDANARKELNARLKLQRQQKEQERKAVALQAAARAAEFWEKGRAANESHPYIVKKGVDALGIRELNGRLMVPVKTAKGMTSLQWIGKGGEKRFLTGGELKGGYAHIVFKSDDQSSIIICEGWATGASLRMATGMPIVIAFNAGNLQPVAESLRKKYPDVDLIIAADNDQWGDGDNVGLTKGRAAARAVGARVCFPEFKDAEGSPTDFNDLHLLQGLEAVRAAVNGAVFEGDDSALDESQPAGEWSEVVPLDAYEDDMNRDYGEVTRQQVALYTPIQHTAPDANWHDHLNKNDKGVLKPTSLTNCALFLENDDRYRDLFCYDEFAHEKMLINCPPWEDPAQFVVRPVTDEDKTRLAIDLEIKRSIAPSPITLRQAFDSVVLRNSRNPAQEYFKSIEWDGERRLETWLRDYLGADEDAAEYLALVGRRWLVAAVARVFEAGCKFDHMLILEGEQGLAKSLALETLATICGRTYFDDTLKVTDLGTDKAVPKLQGILICELAEMSGLRKKDVSELKQSITTTRDRIVKKYANEATYYPRQFVFAGTINPLKGYLNDATGERRFWPVRVKRVDLDALKRDREQLWAEAYYYYEQGERLWISDDEKPLFDSAQYDRRAEDPWQPLIENEIAHLDEILRHHMDDIWRAVGVEKRMRDGFLEDRINKCLSAMGYEYKRKQLNGTRQYMWVRKGER